VQISALRVRAGRSATRPAVEAPAAGVPVACLRTPLGRPVCVDVGIHRPLWRHR